VSSYPECKKCGDYIYHGPVLCDGCATAQLADAQAEVERLRTYQQDVMNDYEAVHRELDRLGAPRRQDSGFGYLPLGRLRKLSVNECGEGLKDALLSERNTAETQLAVVRAKLAQCREAYQILEDAPELNPSNYDHEQVCELNAKMVEAYLAFRAALDATKAERKDGGNS